MLPASSQQDIDPQPYTDPVVVIDEAIPPAPLTSPESANTAASTKPVVTPKTPVQYNNLWQAIGQNQYFNVQPHPRLQKRIQWYLSQPNYLLSANKRAEPYLFHIVERIKQQKLPLELALLPFVESDFHLNAKSSEHAAGVWQLMPATAHHFGIVRNQWYDGRLDVLAATDAALAYLKYLHRRFDGDWLHAIAAYNSGEGRVKQAIEANQKLGKSTHFWNLKLPKETADYVPKLLALSYLVRTPNTGFKLPILANRPLSSVLDVAQPFDFSVLAKLMDIDKKVLHRLNPGYLQHRSGKSQPFRLVLPFDEQALVRKPFYKEYFTLNYTVAAGDTLYKIARRYNMPLTTLRALNNKQDNMLRVGDKLRINQPHKKADFLVDYQISPFLAKQKEKVIPSVAHQHIVQAGESLWSISRNYNVAMKDLIDWNQLGKRSILKLGQILTIQLPKPSAEPVITYHDPLTDLQLRLKQNSKPL